MKKLKEMFYNAISKDIIQKNFKATGNRLAKGSLDPEEEKMIVTIAKDKQSKMIFLSIENEEGTTYSLPLNEDFIRTLNDLFEKWYLLASTEFVWQITNSTKWEAIPIPQKKRKHKAFLRTTQNNQKWFKSKRGTRLNCFNQFPSDKSIILQKRQRRNKEKNIL